MMQIPKHPVVMLAILTSAFLSFYMQVSGDVVEFDNGDILTGKIQAFEQEQLIFQSPMATQPLKIKTASLNKITFHKTRTEDKNPSHKESLTLINDDVLSCRVNSMDGNQLHISTRYAGDFSISRSNIRSLQFGIDTESTLFIGNKDPTEWTQQSGKWSLSNTNTYLGSGSLAQELALPENVCFKFDLSWEDTPNFAFRFCAENQSFKTKQDTYELIFNSAGMQIRRYENKHQPSALLANIAAINPYKLKNNSINIELRVNRSENLISLYIDSKLIGTWLDPLSTSKGNHMIFENRTQDPNNCALRNIVVTTLNDGSSPRHREKISTVKTDLLIDSEGEKISGSLMSINGSKTSKRIVTIDFKHTDEPLKVPDHRVSALFFAKPDHPAKLQEAEFSAFLIDGGRLQLDNPILANGKLMIIHPLLGPCSLSPSQVSHITRNNPQPNIDKPATP